jgi:hypothetical protein
MGLYLSVGVDAYAAFLFGRKPLARPSRIPVGCEVDAVPPIVQERARTSRGVPETASRFLRNQPTGTSWDFSRIPLHPSSAPAKCLPGPIQRKLKVGAVDDPLEHEADRVADQVMRMPTSDAVTISSRPQVSRKCDTCEEEEEEKLQKKEMGPQTVAGEAPASVHETLRSAGQPLDMESHAFFEPRFGRDLSQVRIHADPRAAESAASVYARAYTVGHHVVFGRDQYAPHTADGRHLLAHELIHTLQQQGGVPSLRRDPPKSPPTRPDLETRLKIIEETGPATQARLDQIIRTGGPMPNTKHGAKVIGAAIIDVEGYQGPKEMRAINGADTDALGQGAPVYHAPTPTTRTLSATQGPRTEKGGREPSIRGPRKESINPHINDAEMKLFEDIIPRLPKGAKGTIYFTTVRVPKGQTVIEPVPACSGCIRASFETAGLPRVDLISHAPVHPPMAKGDLGDVPQRGSATRAGGTTQPVTTTEGGITVPQRGSATRAGGTTQPVTTTEGMIGGSTKTGGGPPPGGRARAFGGAVASTAGLVLLNYLGGKVQQHFDEKLIKNDLDRMQPAIQTVLIQKQKEVERLLQQTNMEQTIYANIHIEISYSFVIDPEEGAGPMQDYAGTRFTGLEISTQDVNREEGWTRTPISFIGHYDHHQSTYSVPVFDPAVKFLEDAAQWKREHPGSETPFDRLKEQRDREEGQPRQKYEFDQIRGTWVRTE